MSTHIRRKDIVILTAPVITKYMLYARLIPKYILQKNVGTTPKGVAPTFHLLCIYNYKICICSDA